MTSSRNPVGRVIALADLATFIDGYDLQSLGLAVPLMAPAFGRVPADFGMALTATFVGMFLGAALLAPMGDRVGRRFALVISMWIVAIGTAAAAAVHDIDMLIVARLFTGMGIGAAVPVAIALVSEYASAANRTVIVTAVVVATGIGAFAAGMTAPVIVTFSGWRGIFILGAAMPTLSAILLTLFLPADGTRRFDTSVAKGGVRILLRPPYGAHTRLLWLIFPLNFVVTYALIAWLPTLLVAAGWATADAQRGSGLVAIGGIAGGPVLGWFADRGHAVGALVFAYVVAGISLFLIGMLPPSAWLTLLLVGGITSFGAAMMLGALSAQFYPAELRASGTGWASAIGRLGSIVGPLGVTMALRRDVASPFIIAALVAPMAVCAIAALFLSGRDDRGKPPPQG